MSQITEEIRSSATELYKGDEICQEKSKFLLKEVGLPNGLLPMKDMEECGYVKDTGFVWLKSKKKTDHKFEQIGRAVQYSTEVTAYVEPGQIKKLTGVKAKELMLWLTLNEIRVDDPPTGKIHFKTTTGLARTFPVSAFQVNEEGEKEEEDEDQKKEKPVATPAINAPLPVKEL
ncbi:uncharacterized protein LOC116007193 [Ipomoea triloba]|uniref:uncharacterized protein LOC116007193 n=1 Tax=Ipomoea triloba TaxID=35885 RepID=UPI00125E4B8E|nr:uncharacterized protein LOC116007193 [Ipomoea triloba]